MFLTYIHSFRALAILFVVMGHAIDAFQWQGHGNLERVLRIALSNGSLLFIFIAGYLFQHLSANFSPGKYYATKVRNVIIPYLLISVPAIVLSTTVMDRTTVWAGFYDNPVWKQVVLFYLTGYHLAPLWFVPMICIFYVFAPAFVKLDRNYCLYLLLPVFIVASLLVSRGAPLQSFVHFVSAYVLGMACSRFKAPLQNVIGRTSFLIPVLALYVVMGLVEYNLNAGTMTSWNYLQKVFAALFFLGLLYRWNDQLDSQTVGTIAETSFGVFFIHAYFLTACKFGWYRFFPQLPDGSFGRVLLLSLATLFVCVPTVMIIRKATGRYSRYLLGC